VTGDRGEDPGVGASLNVGSAFRDLDVYRLAVEMADRMHREAARWDSFDRWSLGLQLVRAADSVGANIAEGTGRWHVGDRRRLLFVARGSLYEAEHWILRGEARGRLKSGEADRLSEIGRALNGLIKREPPA
jgi:four helix bundle protein